MKIISNKNIPKEAKIQLESCGGVLYFETKGITYSAISGHPDVFMCLIVNELVIAPNTPVGFKDLLNNSNIKYTEGKKIVGNNYPKTAGYNAVVTENYLIHKLKITDTKILELCADKQAIHVNQAYTRCNLLPLKDDSFITSDKGIFDTLLSKNLNVLLVRQKDIILPGFDYGFFGGACGVYKDTVFIVGSLDRYNDGEKVRAFLLNMGYEIIELYDGPLFDCGSLFIIT
ncbi:MAG: hypothetical protein QM503_08355 [Bacteroidota bacterium]